jgi:hypothetical protein
MEKKFTKKSYALRRLRIAGTRAISAADDHARTQALLWAAALGRAGGLAPKARLRKRVTADPGI